MRSESNVRTATVRDAVALRAFAHPVRMRLYELVGRSGRLTAADAARELGISHALASHHLRQLAKYGFVEPAEASDERARPWRVSATSVRFAPDEPGGRASRDVVDRFAVEQAGARLADWQARRDGEDPRWAELAGALTSILYLEPAELERVLDAWRALLVPLADARPIGHPDQRPPGAVPVSLTLAVVPMAPTEHGG